MESRRGRGGGGHISLAAGVAILAIPLAMPAFAQPLPDPLRAGSLPLGLHELAAATDGEWQVELTTSYFNELQASWHTATIHRELGREGLPVSDVELLLLESRHSDDNIYHLDLEGWRNDLTVSRGFGRGLTLTLHVPWIEIGRPRGDSISRDFHDAFGIAQNDRLLYPKGETLVYLWAKGRRVERRRELEGSGVGDVTLSLAGAIGRWLGAEHRWAVSLEAPTGDEGEIGGSGGWDLGLRWSGTWSPGRQRIMAAAGWTRLDRGGSILGFDRRDTWHLLGEWRSPPWRKTTVIVQARLDSNPLDHFEEDRISEPAFIFNLGATRLVGKRSWLAIVVGENYPNRGAAPDVSFHLQLGMRLGDK